MIDLGRAVGRPVVVEVEAGGLALGAGAEVLEAGHVADRRIEPDVEELAGVVRDLEAEVGRIARDVPFLQAGVEPLIELVGDLILQAAAAGPGLEHRLEVGEAEEIVLGGALLGHGAGDRRARILQLGR